MNPRTQKEKSEAEFTAGGTLTTLIGAGGKEAWISGNPRIESIAGVPEYIKEPLDHAIYPTYQIIKLAQDIRAALMILVRHRIVWGREEDIVANMHEQAIINALLHDIEELVQIEIKSLNSLTSLKSAQYHEKAAEIHQSIDGMLLALFSAHTKPVSLKNSPFWASLKSLKSKLGEVMVRKTAKVKSPREFHNQLKAFAEVVMDVRTGIVDRIVVKYKIHLSDGTERFMDVRVDRIWRFSPDIVAESVQHDVESMIVNHFRGPNFKDPPPLYLYEGFRDLGVLQGQAVYLVTAETELDHDALKYSREQIATAPTPLQRTFQDIIEREEAKLAGNLQPLKMFYKDIGALWLPPTCRWNEIAGQPHPLSHIKAQLIEGNPDTPIEEIQAYLDSCQEEGRTMFDLINRTSYRQEFESITRASEEVHNKTMQLHEGLAA
jgi:hypothetical protein